MSYILQYYGAQVLHQKAAKVTQIDDSVLELIDAMYNIMYKAKGIGLAAPQVGASKRIIVIDTSDYEGGQALTLINPVITEFSKNVEPYEEGCLSVPGINRDVIRPVEIVIAGVDTDGKPVEIEASGLNARVLQHEYDHLDGILFVDRLEDYVRNELRPDLKKIKKLNSAK